MNGYPIGDVYYGLRNDGIRAGEPSLFLRFLEGEQPGRVTAEDIVAALRRASTKCEWVSLLGVASPQWIDAPLVDALHRAGYRVAVETAGHFALPPGFDWITLSPRVAEHAVRQRTANEVKYVRGFGQAIPRPAVEAEHRLVSPTFDGSRVCPRAMEWCVALVKENPRWRLWVPQHGTELSS